MSNKKRRPQQSYSTQEPNTPIRSNNNFGSNAAAQDRLKTNTSTADFSKNSPGMTGPIAHALHGEIDAGLFSVEGSVAKAGAEGVLANYKDQLGREHPSVGFNVGASMLNGGVKAGTPDNNARFGAGLGLSLGFGSTITDVDNDGIPERNIDFAVGPFSVGWTYEDIFSVIAKDRYLELKRQAEREVYAEIGPFGSGAPRKLQERLDQLVREQIQKVTNPKGR